MFDKEFYPTPRHVLDSMGIDCFDKVVFEPSAGKGDIVDYVKEIGARDVLACELNQDLRKIVQSKCKLIGDDFLKVDSEKVSHINMVIMNPPFSTATRHILHAWHIAPEGCEIISLCNWETVCNNCGYSRSELSQLIRNYGSAENLGNVFSTAERKTDVNVGVVRLFKPVTSESVNFEGFHFIDDDIYPEGDGVIRYSEVRAVVNSYVAAIKCFDRFEQVAKEMNQYTSLTGFGHGFIFKIENGGSDNEAIDQQQFSRAMQKHCWRYVFNKLRVDKYVTKGVMNDVNKFVESRLNYPFTMRNIFKMIETIMGTRDHTMNRAIVEAVDNFTKHTHENRYGVEGWKTNDGHLLNKKFISGWICEPSFRRGVQIKKWNGNFERIADLTKALCYLTGTNYDSIPDIQGDHETNKWYEWGFFEYKLFKKGSGHFKFKDLKVWELLNRKYAKIKGQVLPEKI